MIDIYTTYDAVVPLKSKLPLDVGTGIHDALNNMGQKPHILYTDDEGSFKSKPVITSLANANINHIITRNHPRYIDRFTRAFKDVLYERTHWTDIVGPIIKR